jgi:hypothetical protein
LVQSPKILNFLGDFLDNYRRRVDPIECGTQGHYVLDLRRGNSPERLQLFESLFHKVECFIFLWKSEAHQAATEAGI